MTVFHRPTLRLGALLDIGCTTYSAVPGFDIKQKKKKPKWAAGRQVGGFFPSELTVLTNDRGVCVSVAGLSLLYKR